MMDMKDTLVFCFQLRRSLTQTMNFDNSKKYYKSFSIVFLKIGKLYLMISSIIKSSVLLINRVVYLLLREKATLT